MKTIDDKTLANVVNVLDQTRQRAAQHAYSKTPISPSLLSQLAMSIEHAQRILLSLPEQSKS